jgi:hypothetical protein
MDEPTMKTTSINVRANCKRRPSKISESAKPPIPASDGLKFYKLFLSSHPMLPRSSPPEGAL